MENAIVENILDAPGGEDKYRKKGQKRASRSKYRSRCPSATNDHPIGIASAQRTSGGHRVALDCLELVGIERIHPAVAREEKDHDAGVDVAVVRAQRVLVHFAGAVLLLVAERQDHLFNKAIGEPR